MPHDVYVFGDSHWRVFFPFVNHGAASNNVCHEQDGIRTIDTIANELSGATMWGLLNPSSRHGARNRILTTLDGLGGVDHIGLAFGEVDARYHNHRYFVNGHLSHGRIHELVSRYAKFVTDDLQLSGRVRGRVFIYFGYSYPLREDTLLQPGQPMGMESYLRAEIVHTNIKRALRGWNIPNVHLILNEKADQHVSDDGVHLIPELVYPDVISRLSLALRPDRR